MTRELRRTIWPHKVTIESDEKRDITPIEEWLGERLGAFKGYWNVVYHYNHTDFYFKEGADATMFALKWA